MASMARVPTWAVALALIAACFVPTTLAWGWGYSYSGCSGYPFYRDCNGWTCDGKSCLGNCPYGGYATATCVSGDWKINVTCNSAPKTCTTMPPYCEGVSWPSDSPGKNKVYAYCGAGYCGVVSATCVDGTWVLSGSCQKVQRPPTCSGTPPACEGTSWTCDGYKCHGYCGDGYCGVVTANCWYGQWVVEGYCKKVTYVPPPTCTGTPSPCEGASWSCSSDKCIGFCGNGYAGSINAYCWNRQWVVSGSCQKVTIVPVKPNTCSGMPPSCSGITWSPRCDGKSYCGANCMAGYYEGYVSSTCVNGAWTTPVGTCTPVVTVTKKCHGKPKRGRYCMNWKCSHGKSCKAKCAWGCTGGYKAKCHNGKWKVSGGCKLVSLWNYNRKQW